MLFYLNPNCFNFGTKNRKRLFTLYKKEIADYFNSLIGYISVGLFILLTGLLLWVFPETSILVYGYADLRSFFSLTPYLFMFLIPAVTMGTIAGEKSQDTYDLLMTRPISIYQILSAKFLGCMSIVMLALIPVLLYYFSVYQLGNPIGSVDSGAFVGSFIGLILLSSSFTSLGLFMSVISRNVIVAFLLAAFFCYFIFTGIDSLGSFFTSSSMLGLESHYEAISRGVLDTRDLVYFLSFNVILLSLSKIFLGGGK